MSKEHTLAKNSRCVVSIHMESTLTCRCRRPSHGEMCITRSQHGYSTAEKSSSHYFYFFILLFEALMFFWGDAMIGNFDKLRSYILPWNSCPYYVVCRCFTEINNGSRKAKSKLFLTLEKRVMVDRVKIM